MAAEAFEKLLIAKFASKYVRAAMGHYQNTVEDFQLSEWENSIAKGGKFVEAVLKALWDHVGEVVPAGKHFKAGTTIDDLGRKPATHDDTVRLTIPRACRLLYDVA